ncbi:MAG TPA: hypothetical protein RMF84_07650 [Polyangiaceae bacterium LLY-WYZ-14_1]|nr:hypothetical protein [Polyangiaceae bacterium LLY-WYZ-14_1]
MPSLEDALTQPDVKAQVVRDAIGVIEAEVAEKKGVTGLAIKAGYKTVKGLRPGFLDKVVADLLPEFARALDPMYQDALASGSGVASFFRSHATRAANALLAITDEKAARSDNKVLKGAYDRLRSMAEKQVIGAMPRVADLVARHAPS